MEVEGFSGDKKKKTESKVVEIKGFRRDSWGLCSEWWVSEANVGKAVVLMVTSGIAMLVAHGPSLSLSSVSLSLSIISV